MVAVPTIQPNIRARRALSVVTTVAFDGKLSVAEVSIETGRTHQIRVHLQVGFQGEIERRAFVLAPRVTPTANNASEFVEGVEPLPVCRWFVQEARNLPAIRLLGQHFCVLQATAQW